MESFSGDEMRLVIFLLIGLHCGRVAETREDILYPPPLVYPYGGTFKLIVGIATPISLGGRILVYGQNFQFQFALPQNATFFSTYYSSLTKRRRRSSSREERKIFYQFLEQELERWGDVGDGRSCMMRSICEASEIPLGDEGLMEELFNVILTPDYGNSSTQVDEDYLQAAETGRRGDDCSIIYPGCPQGRGLLDRISEIRRPLHFD